MMISVSSDGEFGEAQVLWSGADVGWRRASSPDTLIVEFEQQEEHLAAAPSSAVLARFKQVHLPSALLVDDVDVMPILGVGRGRKLATGRPQLTCLVDGTRWWSRDYSFAEFASSLDRWLKGGRTISGVRLTFRGQKVMEERDSILVSGLPASGTVGELLHVARSAIEQAMKETALELERELHAECVTVTFSFPPDVRAACAQYLTYFAQFLADLGIAAESTVEERAGKVLFTVMPTNGTEALAAIREALDVYLQLPENPEFASAPVLDGDIAVQQLAANVLHLRGLVMLANAERTALSAALEAKDALIATLRLASYGIVPSGRPLLTSGTHHAHESTTENEEPVGDLVRITEYRGRGFKVDLPELVRRLRRLW